MPDTRNSGILFFIRPPIAYLLTVYLSGNVILNHQPRDTQECIQAYASHQYDSASLQQSLHIPPVSYLVFLNKIHSAAPPITVCRHLNYFITIIPPIPGKELFIRRDLFSKPSIWCFTTYFAEGLPYTIIRTVSSLFLRTQNVSLQSIGLTSLFSLPWILKFLWAPLVDRFGTRRRWMLLVQLPLGVLFIAVGLFSSLPWGIPVTAFLLLTGAFLAATHDVAIDGYYLAALDEKEQAKFVGDRVMAYRIAMMTGTGLITTIGTRIGWSPAFATAGIFLVVAFLYHRIFLPRSETEILPLRQALPALMNRKVVFGTTVISAVVLGLYFGVKTSWYAGLQKVFPLIKGVGFAGWISLLLLAGLIAVGLLRRSITAWLDRHPDSFYAQAFSSFMEQRHIGIILAFVIFLRTGEFLLSNMVTSFMVDAGIKHHYGWIQAAIGLPASIGGALLGGYLISRWSLKKVLFPFLFLQNGTNLIYMALAFALQKYLLVNTGNSTPEPIGAFNLAAVAAVQGFDQFAGGLGTSVLMTFLMRICKGKFKAAHYAIGSGLMSISGLFTGVASGFIAARFGYAVFFGISFVLSIPGMVLAIPVMKTTTPLPASRGLH
ncbi:MAG: MFS transporter [Chitinispirillaceae bacterium]|nr:MFS transporter [Chitinispirillaceae bacterium]